MSETPRTDAKRAELESRRSLSEDLYRATAEWRYARMCAFACSLELELEELRRQASGPDEGGP